MNGLFHAHSGLRYLILLVGVVALVIYAMGLSQNKAFTARARIIGASFAGMLHLQVILGIVLVVMGLYTPKVIGHMVLMIAAAVFAQVMLSRNRRKTPPGYRLPLMGVGGALLLITIGLMAIGRLPWTMTAFGG